MSLVLVDSSIWIGYFKGSREIENSVLEQFIDNNQICTNELILAELIPVLNHRKQSELVKILKSIRLIPLDIIWEEIIEFQKTNLKKGVNRVGISDLIIVQNALQNRLRLYSIDKHFRIMARTFKFEMI